MPSRKYETLHRLNAPRTYLSRNSFVRFPAVVDAILAVLVLQVDSQISSRHGEVHRSILVDGLNPTSRQWLHADKKFAPDMQLKIECIEADWFSENFW